jgi:hypothetical protein
LSEGLVSPELPTAECRYAVTDRTQKKQTSEHLVQTRPMTFLPRLLGQKKLLDGFEKVVGQARFSLARC